ncbi:MAG: hypothetical protein ACR2L1_06770 [Pyrinomonadaceae bacterium]
MKIYLFIFFAINLSITAFAQAGDGVTRSIYSPSPDIQRQRDTYERTGRDDYGMIKHDNGFYLPSRSLSEEEKEEIKRIKDLAAVNADDLQTFKDVLKDSHTGIFRLFPDFNCESKFVVKVNDNRLNVAPGLSAYSFRRKVYSTNLEYFDIQLKKDLILAKGFLSQEILTVLGDIPIENVSLTSDGMKFLVDFKPEKKIQTVRNQYIQISNGIKTDGFLYSNTIKAKANTTYALRVTAYRKSLITRNRFFLNVDDKRFATLSYDKRKDVILVFRIIRKDDDGRLTILWKELSRRNSPNLVYPEKEIFSDFKPK